MKRTYKPFGEYYMGTHIRDYVYKIIGPIANDFTEFSSKFNIDIKNDFEIGDLVFINGSASYDYIDEKSPKEYFFKRSQIVAVITEEEDVKIPD